MEKTESIKTQLQTHSQSHQRMKTFQPGHFLSGSFQAFQSVESSSNTLEQPLVTAYSSDKMKYLSPAQLILLNKIPVVGLFSAVRRPPFCDLSISMVEVTV